MFRLDPQVKQDPVRRWALSDRIFFGHGACHILAGVYLAAPPLAGFWAERIRPLEGFRGSHFYVTDGSVAFDHRGYLGRARLLSHHAKGWRSVSPPGWAAAVERVEFDLLDRAAMNAIKHRGPQEYHGDVLARARRRIASVDHGAAFDRAQARAA